MMHEKSVQKMSIVEARLPRRLGERKPRSAKTSVTATIAFSWAPVPTIVESTSGCDGARKTSPCRSFQPWSSWTFMSSERSRAWYLQLSQSRVSLAIRLIDRAAARDALVDVVRDVPVEDRADHDAEEGDNDDRVDEGEPVDLTEGGVSSRPAPREGGSSAAAHLGVEDVQVLVPPDSPWYRGLDKADRVCVEDCGSVREFSFSGRSKVRACN